MSIPKEIRVGIITGNHFPRLGGMEFIYHIKVKELNKIPNVKVAVACNEMPEIPKTYSYPYPVYRSKSFWIFTKYLNKKNIERMIIKEKINILHGAVLHGGGFEAVKIGKKYGLPVVAQCHGSDVQYIQEIGYGAQSNPNFIRKLSYVLKSADKILCVSNMNRELAIKIAGSDIDAIAINNGVPIEETRKVPYKECRKELGLKKEDFVVMTVGRNQPIKRMELLYSALSLLKDRYKDIKCISIGPKNNLSELTNKYKLENVVVLTGQIPKDLQTKYNMPPFPELINLYRTANLFISCSYIENFSTVVTEALSCGTPVLIGKRHGVVDIIDSGQTGFVLQNETPEGMADMLINLRSKKQELENQRDNIRRSTKYLTWEKNAELLRDMYYSLIYD